MLFPDVCFLHKLNLLSLQFSPCLGSALVMNLFWRRVDSTKLSGLIAFPFPVNHAPLQYFEHCNKLIIGASSSNYIYLPVDKLCELYQHELMMVSWILQAVVDRRFW